jgi:hypothetical protein
VHPADDVSQSDYTPCVMAHARAEAPSWDLVPRPDVPQATPSPQRGARPLQFREGGASPDGRVPPAGIPGRSLGADRDLRDGADPLHDELWVLNDLCNIDKYRPST